MNRPLNQRVCEARIDVARLLIRSFGSFFLGLALLKQPVFLIMPALIANQAIV